MREYTEEERALIWLCACTRTEYRERTLLLRNGEAASLLRAPAEKLFALVGREFCASDPAKRQREAEELFSRLKRRGYFALTIADEDYPESLKYANSPPLVLFGMGKRELLGTRKFCIVGSRITPPWAEKMGRALAEELSEYFTIVTGLAEGGDLSAASGALAGGKLISVLPCGLEGCYPPAHTAWKTKIAASGLVLSESLFDEPIRKYAFHARNRILAGLSEGVLVLSAAKRSGALITADLALDCGREVFALPYPPAMVHGEGCNELIKKGACLVTEAEDILSAFGLERRERTQISLSPQEARVLDVLKTYGESHTAVIAEKASMSVFEVSAVLASLEIKGLAARAGGNKFNAV